MLQLLGATLETFLRAEVPLPSGDVDVSFEPPDRDWSAGVSKPTVNLYLWDVRRSAAKADAGWELVETEDGGRERRRSPARVDCRYLVTAWTSEVRDEHALLGQVLAAALDAGAIALDHVAEPLRAVRPLPTVRLAADDPASRSELWSALGGQLRPGVDLVATVTLDRRVAAAAGPPVVSHALLTNRTDRDVAVAGTVVAGQAPGARTATSPRGSAAVGQDGVFLIRAQPGDLVVLDDGREQEVPGSGPVVFEPADDEES